MKLWVLYQGSGGYTDYAIAILGVYTDLEKAKAYPGAEARYWSERSRRQAAYYARMTPWKRDRDDTWHCEVQSEMYVESWNIESLEFDEPFEPPPPPKPRRG